ncbi:MAG: tryptophan transporter [Clostridioides sp.]|jgi:hypothetical protein|nr:tryptophan transporter [Clostridioides sp.]
MKANTKKMVLNSILLAIGLLLHQLMPALGLPIEPDMALAMLFVVMILNKGDYKTCLISGIITGVFTALTTKFPGGQLPNVLDKVVTVNLMYAFMMISYKLPFVKNLENVKKDTVVTGIMLPVGTLLSGSVFLYSASIIVGLPGSFTALFMAAVVPATALNLVAGLFLFKIINMSLKRASRI